jgi:SP family general alpha glucoside:H+ symporter-like MFS transporter
MGPGGKDIEKIEDRTIGLTDAQLRAEVDVEPELVRLGYEVVERQKKETFREAWRNHWRAACWSIFLTSALFMEGYDPAVVSGQTARHLYSKLIKLASIRSTRSSACRPS